MSVRAERRHDLSAAARHAIGSVGNAPRQVARSRRVGRYLAVGALGTLTVLMTIGIMFVIAPFHGGFQVDFKGDLYDAAHAILRGISPYKPGLIQAEANTLRDGGTLGMTISPRYPPLSMLAVVPLSLLPFSLAAILFVLASACAVIAALWLLEVRDVRCFVVASASAPAFYGVWIGNLSPWLLLGAALMWHWRSRRWLLPVATACAIGAKLFLWPMGAWFLVTRRYRQLAVSVVLTLLLILGSWAVIGFKGLASYPNLLLNVAYIGEIRGSSLVTVLLHIGLSRLEARAVALALTGVLVIAAWRLTRYPDGARRAFGLLVVATLLASPVVWIHSLVLLFVPVALLSPRLSLLWFVPAFANFSALPDIALELIVVAVVCAPLLQRPARTSKPAHADAQAPSDRPARAGGSRVRRLGVASFLLARI